MRSETGEARAPLHHCAEAFQDLAAARILQLTEPKGERINARSGREFIKEALDCEDVPNLSGRAEIRGAQRRRCLPPDLGADIRDCVAGRQIGRASCRERVLMPV